MPCDRAANTTFSPRDPARETAPPCAFETSTRKAITPRRSIAALTIIPIRPDRAAPSGALPEGGLPESTFDAHAHMTRTRAMLTMSSSASRPCVSTSNEIIEQKSTVTIMGSYGGDSSYQRIDVSGCGQGGEDEPVRDVRSVHRGGRRTEPVYRHGEGQQCYRDGDLVASGKGYVTFSESSCTLPAGSCSVTVTGSTTGSVTIAGSYNGHSTNAPSSGSVDGRLRAAHGALTPSRLFASRNKSAADPQR